MKADVLSYVDKVRVCVAYEYKGKTLDYLPYEILDDDIKPIYENLSPWTDDLTGMREYNELPETLKSYVEYIEEMVGIPITIVSVGPDRTQTLRK